MMPYPFPFSDATRQLIDLSLLEDLHAGDATSDAIFSTTAPGVARFVAKEPMVVAGLPVVSEVFRRVDEGLVVSWDIIDGARVVAGPIGTVSGPIRSILRGERTALNFLRHLSGVATLTHAYVQAIGPSGPRIVDTRKTTPGFRELEKYAVRMGGGANHRYSLGSGVMIKNNHIAAAGSIHEAVSRVRSYAPFLLKIEVEVTTLDELTQAVDAGADVVLLDNMDTATMRRAVEIAGGRVMLEASGNITLDRLPELRDVGVDVISCGALTHSARHADISLTVGPLAS